MVSSLALRKLGKDILEYIRASRTWKNACCFIPLVVWVILFTVYPTIPISDRPNINTTFLPWMEKTVFRTLVYKHFQITNHTTLIAKFLDLTAALAYFIHFFFPPSVSMIIWVFSWFSKGPKNQLRYVWAFGLTSGLAVLTQYTFPTAPPWYYDVYPDQAPNYHMKGSPAGLAHADHILGINFFRDIYETSPVVFGSFPSLYAAWPVLVFLVTPASIIILKALAGVYVLWVWWAAMYLDHHFFIDVLAGACYAVFSFYIISIVRRVYNALAPRVKAIWKKHKEQDQHDEARSKIINQSELDDLELDAFVRTSQPSYSADELNNLELGIAQSRAALAPQLSTSGFLNVPPPPPQ